MISSIFYYYIHLLPYEKMQKKILPPVFLGRKLSYFPPAGGSGKKNSQTQISDLKKIHKLKFQT